MSTSAARFVDAWGYRWQRELQEQVFDERRDDASFEVLDSEWVAKLMLVGEGAIVGGRTLRHFPSVQSRRNL